MKNGKLSGKVAVVTGASKGIGADIAKQFAAEGAEVVVNYARSKQDADRVVDEIAKRGGKAIAVQGDVAKKSDLQRLFVDTTRGNHRRRISSGVQHERARLDSRHAGSAEIFRQRRRQRDQHQFAGDIPHATGDGCL